MARLPAMMQILVIDTSYLLELYLIPRFSNKRDSEEIRERFKRAQAVGSEFYVPVACVFEMANHIADLPDGGQRRNLAKRLLTDIGSSIENSLPWNVIPAASKKMLPDLLKTFVEEFIDQKIGLTDTQVIHEAKRLKRKYSSFDYTVHIWTHFRQLIFKT